MKSIRFILTAIIFLPFLFFNHIPLFAANKGVDTAWITEKDNPYFDGESNRPLAMVLDNDQGLYIGGPWAGEDGFNEGLLIKYNPLTGEELWANIYSFSDSTNNVILNMGLDSAKDIVVAGLGYEPYDETDLSGLIVYKITRDGEVVWHEKQAEGLYGFSTTFRMIIDDSDNIYVSSNMENTEGNPYGLIVSYKYNADGDLLWKNIYGNPEITNSHIILRYTGSDSDENYYVVGSEDSGNSMLFITYDQNGEDVTPGEIQHNIGMTSIGSLAIDEDNQLFLAGECSGYAGYWANVVIAKASPDGHLIWDHKDNITASYVAGMIVDNNQNLLVNIGGEEQYIVKYSSTGSLIFQEPARSSYGDLEVDDVAVDWQNNLYLVGSAKKEESEESTTTTVCFDTNGQYLWEETTDKIESIQNIELDNTNNIYITGDNDNGWATIKYVPDQGNDENGDEDEDEDENEDEDQNACGC